MAERFRGAPLDQLEEFEDLELLVFYIIDSLKVHEVKVPLPLDFDKTQINAPEVLLPVNDLWIGKASFSYILHRAEYIISKIKEKINKIDVDPILSFTDKIAMLQRVRKEIYSEFGYFNSMNPIRYMSSFKWIIVTSTSDQGKTIETEQVYPNSKLDLKQSHWRILDNTFSIRRDLLHEIIFLLDNQIEKISESLSDTKYGWNGKRWQYELYELGLALIAANKIDVIKGTEDIFLHDFLAFFGKPDTEMSYYKGKILDREKRTLFISDLESPFEEFRRKAKTSD